MNERDFELLDVLSKTQNITKAANELFVTQSSLSKRIQAIEDELGITLLIRSRQGIHFTADGEEVLIHTQRAAAELTAMRQNLEATRGYICGTLNAGVSINYALYRFPKLLAEYRKQFPHVNTHIITDQSRKIYLQLSEGDIDIAIIRGEYPWKDNKILLERENICVICNSKDEGRPLRDIPYIARKTDSTLNREITQWFHENNMQAERSGIYVDNITTCVEMVNNGLGWAIVPEICLKNFKGSIRPLYFDNGEPFVRSTYLMYSDQVLALPQVEAFINIMRK